MTLGKGIYTNPPTLLSPPWVASQGTQDVQIHRYAAYTAPPYEKIRERLDSRIKSILALPPNWDGYGASPVNSSLIQYVSLFIHWLVNELGQITETLQINPSPDGGLLITIFGFESRELELWFTDSAGPIQYVQIQKSLITDGEIPKEQVSRLLDWIRTKNSRS